MKNYFFLLVLFFASLSHSQTIRIMIDPGHGGSDPGYTSTKKEHLTEKEINLIIAKKIGNYLSSKLKNVKISYTRTSDEYVGLADRVNAVNEGKYDYFLSIHCNGAKNKFTRGTETHVHDGASRTAKKWARAIEAEFKKRGGRLSRGIKTNEDRGHSLEVLKYTTMTSILVECGFLTNVKEANYLNTKTGQEVIASAIYRATKKFILKEHPEAKQNSSKKNIAKNNNTAKKIEKPKEDSRVKLVISKTEKTEKKSIYTIHLMSSQKPIHLKDKRFEGLKGKISRKTNLNSKFKYSYFLTGFRSKAASEKALKIANNKGFKDAFLRET